MRNCELLKGEDLNAERRMDDRTFNEFAERE